ncbi:MarR family transcriptional regulator [Hyella patelloides LEGE 07179]|uniref:MarR family transcriptional regulator n=1 Tax=Hyella patelloides LEGE 07179 TaxID=945734 RepID=A0A563VKC1_9CYAN|nr:helix-turn-helix domain-containing GNAT family N-acetyltransferase [Hyella patelloides]VEP11735.1 MarR family transcriptional regulator [Hyella patelloides LEGE 07179]
MSMTQHSDFECLDCVKAVRRFNRFYTQQIGVLHEGLLKSPFSLTEARVIYELAHHEKTTATKIAKELSLDAGYLSRILCNFKKRGLIDKQPSEIDGRQSVLVLTEQGQDSFNMLNACSQKEIEEILNKLSSENQNRLVKAMGVIEELLATRSESQAPYVLRPHQPGDLGWIVHRHGVLYAEEYNWDEQFEALVASIVAKFVQDYDPKQERCWIAERDGEIVGSVFLVKQSDEVAKLRLLLVEPKVRGLGIGTRLVNECVRFARQAGYSRITLWTNNVLQAARHIYEVAGFRLIRSEENYNFGHYWIGETWNLEL